MKKDCKAGNVGNKANGSSTKGLEDGSSNPLKGHNMFNKSLHIYYVTYVSEAYFVQDDDIAWWLTLEQRHEYSILVGNNARQFQGIRFYVIEPNDSVAINSIIESRDAIFDEQRFSSVPRPSKIDGTDESGGSVIFEKVTDEIVQQSEPQLRKISIKDLGEADVILTPVSTLMDTCEKLMPNRGLAVSQLEYSRVIGCLMYAMTYTRPDNEFVVGKVSSYTSNPVLKGYTNASWISNTKDNSSTSGWAYSQMYNGKSRHLGVRHSMIREIIMNGVVSIEFVRSQQNLADHLTNGLDRDLVIKSAEGMGLKDCIKLGRIVGNLVQLWVLFIPVNEDGVERSLMSLVSNSGLKRQWSLVILSEFTL
ncbi:hypothetical protein Tco_0417108, partial [Tanacetum coccineum]